MARMSGGMNVSCILGGAVISAIGAIWYIASGGILSIVLVVGGPLGGLTLVLIGRHPHSEKKA